MSEKHCVAGSNPVGSTNIAKDDILALGSKYRLDFNDDKRNSYRSGWYHGKDKRFNSKARRIVEKKILKYEYDTLL